jgi:hypothetical protein
MKRKIVSWEEYEPPREWTPKLECGHHYPCYDGGLSDEQKERAEADGNLIQCNDCTRLEAELARAEATAADLRKRLGLTSVAKDPGPEKEGTADE